MDRLPDESNPAYEAFKIYLGMGIGRSARETCRRMAKSWQLISKWSAKHHWVERAREFDNRIERITRDAEESKLVMEAGVWAKRMRETREEAFVLSQKLIEKAEAMLKFPLATTTTQDGKTTIKPTRWTVGDAARLIETASRLKQLATGLPTDRFEHAGPEGQPLPAGMPQVIIYVPSNGRDVQPAEG